MMNSELSTQMNNALLDLQASHSQTYERPLKTLAQLFQNDDLKQTNEEITSGLDLEDFLQKSSATSGSMAGSARLVWPEDRKQQLGLTLLLLFSFASAPDSMMNFGFEFFHSRNTIDGIHSIVRQLLIPFVRDYKSLLNKKQPTRVRSTIQDSTKIFIVHGHDGEARETVARYLDSLGFDPIILHEQANKGRTIIEKVEANSDVGFAVVLLTPDDEGCVKGGVSAPRARQMSCLNLVILWDFSGVNAYAH
jgi:hypothetical protein